MMRPTGLPPNTYQPLVTPLAATMEDWDPDKYERRREVPTGIRVSRSSMDNEESPVLNVTAEGTPPDDRKGPLAWIGGACHSQLSYNP
jgi:hypothetical protein